jgi:hypothetical protein
MRGALSTLALLEMGRILGADIGQAIYKSIEGPQQALRQEAQQELEIRKQQTEAALRENDRRNNELLKALRQQAAEANKLYLQDADNFKEAMKVEEQVVKLSFDRIMQSRQSLTRELVAAAENAEKQIQEIARKSADLQIEVADRKFQQQLQMLFGGNVDQQFDALRRKTLTLADEAARLQGSAKDPNQEKLADTAWKRVDAFAKQAEQIANQTKDAQQLFAIQKLIDELDDKRLSALQQQSKTQAGVAKEAEQRANQAESHNLELEQLRRTIEDKLKTTLKDDSGGVQLKGKDQLKRDLTDADGLIAAFVQRLRQYGKEDFIQSFLGDAKAFQSMKQEAERTLASADVKNIQVAPEAISGLSATLQKSLDALQLKCPVLAKIEKVAGLEILTDGLQKVVDAYEKKLNEATARAIRSPQLSASLMATTDEYRSAHKTFDQFQGSLSRFDVDHLGLEKAADVYSEREKLWSLVVEYDQLSKSVQITDESLVKLQKDQQAVDLGKTFYGATDQARIAEALKTMQQALLQRKALLDQQKQNVAPKDENLDELLNIKQQVEEIKHKKDAEGASTAVINDQLSAVDKVIDRVNALAASWGAVTSAASAATQATVLGAESQFAAAGGMIQRFAAGGLARYFDQGGIAPRGTDVIPAMLSPQEFVMSQRATRLWYPQLVAMNAGIKPVFHNSGGSVTNVGDINVTVSGSGSSRQTARSIAAELRRELRRGTSIL